LIVMLGALLFGAVVAQAQARPLALDFVGCDEHLSADALRIAHIELASDREASAATADAHVVVHCEMDAAVVRASRLGLALDKRLPFDTFESTTRARLVALGVAELVRELARLPITAPAPAADAEQPVSHPKPRIPSWTFSVGPSLRYAPRARLLALGGRTLGERRIGGGFSLTLAAEGTTAERAIRDGALRWNHAALELGARGLTTRGVFRFYAEAALAGSFEHLSGQARATGVQGDSFSTTNALARTGLGADLTFLRHGLIALTLDALAMLRTLRAENVGVQTISIGPVLLGATLVIGARW
jgi:hypothetical protein